LTHVTFPLRAFAMGGNGVIHMGLLNIIRKLRLRQGLPIREIARRTGLSRIEAVGRHRSKTDG
jgi:hypothetical protein